MEQMREKYESLSAFVLKDLAKARGIKGVSSLKKGQIIERMLEEDAKIRQKASSSISFPLIRIRSLSFTRCGDVKNPTRFPSKRRIACIYAQTLPFPFVPAT